MKFLKSSRLVIASAVVMALVSCTSVDSLIDQMDKAVEKGDIVKYERIARKLYRKTNDGEDLTVSQASKIAEIAVKATSNYSKDAKDALDAYSSVFGGD